MTDKLRFIFDYNQYISNIDSLSHFNDSVMYNIIEGKLKFGNIPLSEGLISTYPLNKSVDIIKKRFPKLDPVIEEDGEIYIIGDFDKISEYIPLFTNLGYFISSYTTDGNIWRKEYNKEDKPMALFLEPKYDIKIYPIPMILYHTSASKFDQKISKIGFIPKSGNKLSNHPERIYLTDNFQTALKFGLNMKVENNEDFSIYEINTNGLEINLYSDINLRNGGYYTMSNIPKEFFKKIK